MKRFALVLALCVCSFGATPAEAGPLCRALRGIGRGVARVVRARPVRRALRVRPVRRAVRAVGCGASSCRT